MGVTDHANPHPSMKSHPLLLALAAWIICPWRLVADEVTVFAAASLTESLQEIGRNYQQQSGVRIHFNIAGSGQLSRQIQAGAPADLFFSADESKMDQLAKLQLLAETTRRSLLSNQLVVVAAAGRSFRVSSPADLTAPAITRLAIGDPNTVPAGTYARDLLRDASIWQKLQPKLIPCMSVRAVLAAVESGNVDAGIVYRTDAAVSRKVRILWQADPESSPKISYPVAILRQSPQPAAARKFLDYLSGPEAAAVFTARGFVLMTDSAPK